MNKITIAQAFKKKAFIPFITAGDQGITTTEKYIRTMTKAGASLIEIGIPFSDPVAEGPVIQAASERALSTGITTDGMFEMVQRLRTGDDALTIPLVFMTYMNPIYVYGVESFMKRCEEVGVQGVIVPDCPFEEKQVLGKQAKEHGVSVISLIAPTSEQRIKEIAADAEGFVYCVSSLGVTGMRSDIKTDIESIVQQIRQYTDIPVAVGFGISTPDQAKAMAHVSDGAIVGSAIVKQIGEWGQNGEEKLYEYIRSMVEAIGN